MPHPLPVINDTFRCALNWTMSDFAGSAENVMHVRAGVAGKTAADIFEAIDDALQPSMFAAQYSNAFVQSVSITPLDGVSATVEFLTPGTGDWVGGSSGQPIPQQANLIKLSTGLRGRSFRGRLFLPWVAENATSNGSIGSSLATTITTAWTAFQTALQADADGPYELVVASYKLASAHTVTAVGAEPETGTQRRRQSRNR
jgi:hypothetical protein